MSRVVLAMSGGVDSSVAAHLLRQAGHDVIGVFMRHGERSPVACSTGPGAWGNAPVVASGALPQAPAATAGGGLPMLPVIAPPRLDHKQGCCSAADADDARRVAERLDIPFYALNLEEEFREIIDYFVDEYTLGRTPNPCVVCNTHLKFGRLFDYADSVGADYVATGHYAQLETDAAGLPMLCRGRDDAKDQSYVLFGVDRGRLSRMMLPIGGFEKPEIRRLAAELDLRVATKRDSQEICFVTSGHHDEFVRDRRGQRADEAEIDTSGEIVTTDGQVVGRHAGIEGFTVGQRKGLRVALGERRFVVRIERDTRRVVIGSREDLARSELTADNVNWLCDPPQGPTPCLAQIRYNSTAHPAVVEPLADGRIHVWFDEPQHGVAPGQAVVCFDGQRVLGGGWIE
ncbi:MAG: tRNA 2-thiouridine(34) synthase MnmA [Planctomycetia bacterium]|nr:tRNA 2-thiouridine(34) synthase MnmA [Planctomycetia bacterium]